MKSTAADTMRMNYTITGAGADQPPKGLFTVDKYTGMLWVTKSLDREETEEYIVSDLRSSKNLDFKHNMLNSLSLLVTLQKYFVLINAVYYVCLCAAHNSCFNTGSKLH